MVSPPPPSPPSCIAQVAARYSVPAGALRGILHVEGGGKNVVHANGNGTEDLGWMQINSSWLAKLAPYHITRKVLLSDRCINISVGAWILSGEYVRFRDWRKAIRAYNVGADLKGGPDDGRHYAHKVMAAWRISLNPPTPLVHAMRVSFSPPSPFVFTPESSQ